MEKVFIDTNVMIDFLLEREDFYDNAGKIVELAYRGFIELSASSLSYNTAYYIMRKATHNHMQVINSLKTFSTICTPTVIDKNIVQLALNSSFKDFEDALQYFSALSFSSDTIISRNKQDFLLSAIKVQTPEEFLE